MNNHHITLLRHAIAHDAAPGQNDRDRVLSEQGQRRLIRVSRGLEILIDSPELIVSSPLIRAEQSADIVARYFPDAKRLCCEALAPCQTPETLLHWLRWQTQRHVILIGHEPDLSQWAGWMLSGQAKSLFKLTKAGACQLEFSHHAHQGNAQLHWLMTSKQLRRINACRANTADE